MASAYVTPVSHHTLQWAGRCSPKNCHFQEVPGCHIIRGSFSTPKSTFRMVSPSAQPFLQGSPRCPTHRCMHADRPSCLVRLRSSLSYLLASVKKTKAEYWEAFSRGHKHPVNVWGTLLRKDGYDVKCLCDCRPASTEYLPGGEWCSTARTGHDQRHVYSASFPDANSRVTGSRGGSCMWSSFCALWKIISSCFSNGGDRPHRCMLPPR